MKKIKETIALGIFCLSFMPAWAQCNPNDSIESWYDWAKNYQNMGLDYFALSIKDENIVGDSLHKQITKEYVLEKNYFKQDYLNKIVAKLTPFLQRKGIDYQIHVINDTKTFNAFSVAGGHIYITTKMIDWTTSEDELAFIIGHEMAHIDQKHGARKVQQSLLGQSLFGAYGTLAANASLILTQPFGQIDEYRADSEGAILVTKAGYDVRKGLRFFKMMSSQENYTTLEKLIRTHPYSIERYTCLEDFITNTLHK